MHKIAVVIYTNITTDAVSRAYRAMNFVEELLLAGDDVTLIFDGGGAATLAAIIEEDHPIHRAWLKAKPAFRGVCEFCAKSYNVHEKLSHLQMLKDFKGHASLRALLEEGRQIVTF